MHWEHAALPAEEAEGRSQEGKKNKWFINHMNINNITSWTMGKVKICKAV